LIEDDEDLCHSLTDLLRDQGYRVSFATGIDHALNCLTKSDFHIILLDMQLPGGFGDEVFSKVRGIRNQVRVVLSTGHRQQMEERIQRALGDGADAVCYKPFQMAELLTPLKRLSDPLT
jgi:DNA-binding response OmpR family regulator